MTNMNRLQTLKAKFEARRDHAQGDLRRLFADRAEQVGAWIEDLQNEWRTFGQIRQGVEQMERM